MKGEATERPVIPADTFLTCLQHPLYLDNIDRSVEASLANKSLKIIHSTLDNRSCRTISYK
jgi:hypothetical protein